MGTFGAPRRRTRRHDGGLFPVFSDHNSQGAKPDYKTAALCKQVRRILAMTLSGECADPLLQSLIVDEVLPAPSAGRLLVRLLLRDPVRTAEILTRLAAVEGLLRARIAEGVARKRTPELAFDLVPLAPPLPPAAAGGGEGAGAGAGAVGGGGATP